MGKTQIASALVLALLLAGMSGNAVFAETETTATYAASSASEASKAAAVQNVENASAKNEGNKIYPGLSEYLNGVAAKAPQTQADVDTMNEIATAANLLAGRKVNTTTNTNARSVEQSGESVVLMAESQAETTPTTVSSRAVVAQPVAQAEAPEVVQAVAETPVTAKLATAVKVTVSNPEDNNVAVKNFDENGAAIDDELMNKDETPAPEVTPELPKTGEIKSNLGILIMAGIAVALVVFGATAVIVKGRKHHA